MLASYGVSERESCRRGAGYVVRILKGAKPGDLPGRAAFGEMVAYLKARPSVRVMLVEKTDAAVHESSVGRLDRYLVRDAG